MNAFHKVKVGLVNLGCPKNQVDSEVMLGTLSQDGFELTPETEQAEVIVINTCGFIDAAKQESIDAIIEFGRYKKSGACRVLIAAGCLAHRYPKELMAELPELDAVVGTGDFPKIAGICRTLLARGRRGRKEHIWTASPTALYDAATPRLTLSPRHWAYLKVSEGCNYRCSFCAIPNFRGDLVSRAVEDILIEARSLAERGVVELNLIAQSLTSFGWDRREKRGLMGLLRPLAGVDGIRRIRLFYTYPTDLTDELLDFMAEEPKICNYVDLPLQHINDAILRKMNRKGSSRMIRSLLTRIREKVPGVTLRSTFIVGFPGETEAQFEEITDLIREVRFDRLGVFTYSQEDGTSAHPLGDSVPAGVKAERQEKLLALQSGIVREKHATMIGTVQEVLVDGPSRETDLLLEGRTEGQAPEIDGVVYINDGAASAGDMVKVEITQAGEHDLVGHIVGPAAEKIKAASRHPSGLTVL
ncbi:MAG TPA: 30S ribosomal protein S12 methylthiotransferase RimO [Nitrospiria bacterium]|nr:30S ribosomal protein S12 methylthiotransferase RimO [Nitrospiria bacterium]